MMYYAQFEIKLFFIRIDAENLWVLEQWLLYVQEMTQLKQREEELKLLVSEFEVNEEYKSLQLQLKEVQNTNVGILIASDSEVTYFFFVYIFITGLRKSGFFIYILYVYVLFLS